MSQDLIIVITTVASKKDGRVLATKILESRLAACIHIYPVQSMYWWQEKIESDEEFVLQIKTTSSTYARLEKFIEKEHPYDTPEIVAIPARFASNKYLEWMESVVKKVSFT